MLRSEGARLAATIAVMEGHTGTQIEAAMFVKSSHYSILVSTTVKSKPGVVKFVSSPGSNFQAVGLEPASPPHLVALQVELTQVRAARG